MDQIASFVVFMLAAMAISLSVLVAVVFCIGICEGASWMWMRLHLSCSGASALVFYSPLTTQPAADSVL